jgi:hypothetical protein
LHEEDFSEGASTVALEGFYFPVEPLFSAILEVPFSLKKSTKSSKLKRRQTMKKCILVLGLSLALLAISGSDVLSQASKEISESLTNTWYATSKVLPLGEDRDFITFEQFGGLVSEDGKGLFHGAGEYPALWHDEGRGSSPVFLRHRAERNNPARKIRASAEGENPFKKQGVLPEIADSKFA